MNESSAGFFARGGGWAVVQFILMTLVFLFGHWYRGTWSSTTSLFLGDVLFLTGALIFCSGLLALRRNLTPYTKPSDAGTLVRRGIYRHIRHPLYSGVMLGAVGWALRSESAPSLGVALALIPFFQAKVNREEHWLYKRFPDYADYARRVPRFMPHCRWG